MEEKKDTIKLLPPSDAIDQNKEDDNRGGFLRRAFNRTKEAFRSVDEAITGREAAKRIEDRFHQQSELNEALMGRIEELFERAEKLHTRLDEEIITVVKASAEQREAFDRTFTEIKTTAEEITSTATELRFIAEEAQSTLTNAKNQQLETQQQASTQMTRWNSDAELIKNEARNLQNQLAALQQSMKTFQMISIAIMTVLAIAIAVVFFYLKR